MSARTSENNSENGRRLRKRLRGMFETRAGKAAGLASLAAPLIGYVVRDLKKPDSIIRGLIGTLSRKLLTSRVKNTEALDITDKVEILEKSNGN